MVERGAETLAGRIQRAMAARGIRPRALAMALGDRHWSTAYRVLSGTTADPLMSTVLDVCRILDVDPDEILGATSPPLEPETQALLEAARALPEEDRWLIVDLVRVVRRRAARGERRAE